MSPIIVGVDTNPEARVRGLLMKIIFGLSDSLQWIQWSPVAFFRRDSKLRPSLQKRKAEKVISYCPGYRSKIGQW